MSESNEQRLTEKYEGVIEAEGYAPITDNHKKFVLAQCLENMLDKGVVKNTSVLTEDAPANNAGDINSSTATTGAIAGQDTILISMLRRAMPNHVAYDIAGVQPMNGPTGIIFAFKSKYTSQDGTEALFNEANSAFSGDPTSTQAGTSPVQNIAAAGDAASEEAGYLSGATLIDEITGVGMSTADGETLGGTGSGDLSWNEMAFSIEKASVEAKTRALKGEYTQELAQDMMKVHGLDAEAELANIISAEILSEQNRELIRTINFTASVGAANATSAGVFDTQSDSTGRWQEEQWKGLLFQIELEANAIAKSTRRGKGNIMICSSNVASALNMIGVLTAASPAGGLVVDDSGNTFVGTIMGGRMKVYVDPYTTGDYVTVGYRGGPMDAGIFYCPYIPLEMVKTMGEETFQPKIAFKTRYGMIKNPFSGTAGTGAIGRHDSTYYRIFAVNNLL